MRNEITDKRFFEAGRAVFTVDNGKGTHYTYKISHRDENQPLFVSLLTGPDNTSSYTYMGIYDPNTHQVRLTQKSKYTEETQPVKVVRWAIKQVVENKPLPEGYQIHHEGRCCKCGRTLTTRESCDRGVGPECWEKMGWH